MDIKLYKEKKFILASVLICILSIAISCSLYNEKTTVKKMHSKEISRISPEEFVIFPWDHLAATSEQYKAAYDCGFNIAGFVAPENFDMVYAAGLKGFVAEKSITIRENLKLNDEQIQSNVNATLLKLDSHPGVFGYHLIDEPDTKLLPTVAKWVQAFNKSGAKKIPFVNLFPSFDPVDLEKNYENYLLKYINLSNPPVFSYDNYSLINDGTIRKTFFANFEKAREVSLKTGVPFWFVGLANSHFDYMEPTNATLNFQAYLSLIYGARGIGWFTYTSRDRGNYRLSAIDFDGSKTPTWDFLRAANMQIHNLAPVYIKLKSVNVFYHPDVPWGCKGIESSRYLKSIEGKGPFAVGEFEHPDGKPYFLILNRNLTKSTWFKVIPKKDGKLMKVSSFTGKTGTFSAENDWLAQGQGMLLFYE